MLARIIRTQEAAVGTPMEEEEEDTNRVDIISSNSHMVAMGPREVTSSSSPSMDREATAKIPAMAAPPKPSPISKSNHFYRATKELMEFHQSPRSSPSGNLQHHPMVKHTTTMNERRRRLGKSPRECHRGYRKVLKRRFPLPLDMFDDEKMSAV